MNALLPTASCLRRRLRLAVAALLGLLAAAAAAQALPSLRVQPARSEPTISYDGVVEAVRQTVIAAQVQGAVVDLRVRVGDRVQAGQVLLRLDARAAQQAAAASDAQVLAARAGLEVATREFARQRQLFEQRFISQAALDQAEAQFKATQAQLQAQIAQAAASRTQSGFYVVRAPYAGVVADVPVSLGEMALPGKPLLTLYDPAALRVVAPLPQSTAAAWTPQAATRIEIPSRDAARRWLQSTHQQLIPAADPATHTMQLRLDLPAGTVLTPGTFARVWLPADGAGARIAVPLRAVVRRAELAALYVLGEDGQVLLRQVRLGRSDGDTVEVLAGLSPGERIVLDPQAAAARAR
jgi:RND family efflux transporter MFP subunit